jgi:hypothetical protein
MRGCVSGGDDENAEGVWSAEDGGNEAEQSDTGSGV